nr:ligase-associated DNA damage response endonuclease PdeM [Fulvimarina manganoxydans]
MSGGNLMNALARRMRQTAGKPLETEIAGTLALLDPSGVLVLPSESLLVVSDLHLEKGAAFARRGMMLPPYDTAATLALLARALSRHPVRRVVCLGDSFHDRRGAEAMPTVFRDALVDLMVGHDWVWVSGNHDPEPPKGLGGETVETLSVGGLALRHEPTAGACPGEIAGHLHPVARIRGAVSQGRHACFASDGTRMILPSFGITTGGLNVLDRAFSGLFETRAAKAFVAGTARIYPIPFSALG